MAKQIVTCRYGVTYEYEVRGSYGQKVRFNNYLKICCCFCCQNHDCKEPRDERLNECDNPPYGILGCELYTKIPYCLNKPDNK